MKPQNLALLVFAATTCGFRPAVDPARVLDLGELESLDAFLSIVSTNSSWKDITVYDNTTRLIENPDQIHHDHNSSVPLSSLTHFQRRDACHRRNGWERIICDDMPNHKWDWNSGEAFPIRYDSAKMMRWLESMAKEIQNGKDLRDKWHDGKALGERDSLSASSNSSVVKFTVPMQHQASAERYMSSTDNGQLETNIYSHYQFDYSNGELSYQGTTATFSDAEPAFGSDTGDSASANGKPSKDFTIVLQVWRKSDAMPMKTMSETCLAKVMLWHIDRASHTHRFVCTQIDARGDWWAWYDVNINHGTHVVQTNGACCAN